MVFARIENLPQISSAKRVDSCRGLVKEHNRRVADQSYGSVEFTQVSTTVCSTDLGAIVRQS